MSPSPAGPPSTSSSPGEALQKAVLDGVRDRARHDDHFVGKQFRLVSQIHALQWGRLETTSVQYTGAEAHTYVHPILEVHASCDSLPAAQFPLSAEPVVDCATDVFTKCAIQTKKNWQTRLVDNSLKIELRDCQTACQAFIDILAINKGRSLLIDGDRAIEFPRPSGWEEDTSEIGKGITTAHTVYQGFRTLLTALVNVGDGATLHLGAEPLQPKGFAQFVLQIMAHVKEFNASKDDIEKLQSTIESTWGLILEHYRPGADGDVALDGRIRKFLRLLIRTVVRLHLLRATPCTKRFVAVVTVKDIIVDEAAALNNAKGDLMMALSFSSRAAAADHQGDIDIVRERVVRIDNGMEDSGRKLDVIASGVDDASFQPWLGSNYDFQSRQHELLDQIDENPEWIVSDPDFVEWKATQGIYWISSTPGAGKSVLLAAIIRHLDTRDRVFFHFDKRNEAQQPTFRDFLVAIVRQLATGPRPYPPQLKEAYASRIAGQKASEEVLADAVTTMMGSEPRVVLAIDALDECPDVVRGRKLFPLINRLVEVSARIIVTSREIEDIFDFMPTTVRHLRLNSNHQHIVTLCSFVDSQLATSKYEPWPAGLKSEVKKILTESHCMFLWVRLQLERLKGAATPTAVRKMVHSLPPTLDETYARILRDFTPTNDPLRITLASRILQCVAMSASSLSPAQLAELLAFEFPPGNEIPVAGQLLAYDPGLFIDDPEALIRSHCPALLQITDDKRVHFIHVSVVEYLQSAHRFKDPLPVSSYAFTTDWAHLTWIHVCLSIFELKLELKITSLAEHAWISHLISTTDSFRAAVLDKMLAPAPTSLRDRFTVLTSFFDTTVIHRACDAGRLDLVTWFVANSGNAVVEARDAWQNSPLHDAARRGHAEMVKLLLWYGALPSATNEQNQTPLHDAARNGHLDTARLLLDAGAPIDAWDEDDRSPLHDAAWWGHSEVVELLLQHGALPSMTNKHNQTPLHYAAREGRLDAVRVLLDAGAQVDAQNKVDSALHDAAWYGHSDIVELLLQHGAPPSPTNKRNQTPLHYAAQNSHLDSVQLLLDAGAPVDARDEDGKSPLHDAAERGGFWRLALDGLAYSDIVELLLQHGATPSATNKQDHTPLHYAAREGHIDMVRLLLDAGAPVDARDEDDKSPLHYAAVRGHSGIVELILEHGALPSATDKRNQTPLHLAANPTTVRMLIDGGAPVNARDKDDRSPLHDAAWCGHSEVVELLLQHGALPSMTNKHNQTPLHYAAREGRLDAVRVLLEGGALVDVRDKDGDSPLHVAASYIYDLEVVELLLQHGARPSETNKQKRTPLHLAARAGHLNTVRMLLDAGAQVDVRDAEGNSSLHYAARNIWGSDVVELLLQHGALPSMTNKHKQTPLHYAAREGRLDAVRVLLQGGAPVDAWDEHDDTPLHVAARYIYDSKVVELLLMSGAQPSATNEQKRTPLHLAAKTGHFNAVRMLLDAVTPVDARDEDGDSPLHYAARRGRSEVVELLLQHGAPPSPTNKQNHTPLHYAAQNGFLNEVRLLLDAGAQVNARDQGDNSPVDAAAQRWHSEIVELLLKYGAQPSTTSFG